MSLSLQPPEEETAPLVAAPPAENVTPDNVQGIVPAVAPGTVLQIREQARSFVLDAAKTNPSSPDFAKKVAEVATLAQKEFKEAGAGASKMLQRSSSSIAGAKRTGSDATVKVTQTLSDLRNVVEDLTPRPEDLTGVQKVLGIFPGAKKIRRYFQKYESAQTQIDNIIKALLAGKDDLLRDNASLQEERKKLWSTMEQLNEYIVFAEQIDAEIVAEIERLKNAGDIQAATMMDTEMLYAVRQRRKDLITQMAVSAQGYMMMDIVRKNNVELIRGVERASTTTIQALTVAVTVAQALDNQKLVLDKIDAVNKVTNDTILATSQMLRQNSTRIQDQAMNSGVSVETLTQAFDNIYATMDELDAFKRQANENMSITINSMTEQLERAKPRLESIESANAREAKSITG